MKKIKYLLIALLVIVFLASFVGCYMVSGQRMDTVKGTYKLTTYTYTPKYERKDGFTPRTINYIEDEDYLQEVYLVITGTGNGYYVFKDVNNSPFVRDVYLNYQYNTDDSSKVDFVTWNDSLSVNSENGLHKMGVTKNGLNYSKPAMDYTELFTQKKMRSEAMNIRWEKVSRATDLSYVEQQLGAMKHYNHDAFKTRGIYELERINIETGAILESEYQYVFCVLDTATNACSATVHYALKSDPTTRLSRTLTLENPLGNWNSIILNGLEWNIDEWNTHYFNNNETTGEKLTLDCVSNDISNEMLDWFINDRSRITA